MKKLLFTILFLAITSENYAMNMDKEREVEEDPTFPSIHYPTPFPISTTPLAQTMITHQSSQQTQSECDEESDWHDLEEESFELLAD